MNLGWGGSGISIQYYKGLKNKGKKINPKCLSLAVEAVTSLVDSKVSTIFIMLNYLEKLQRHLLLCFQEGKKKGRKGGRERKEEGGRKELHLKISTPYIWLSVLMRLFSSELNSPNI